MKFIWEGHAISNLKGILAIELASWMELLVAILCTKFRREGHVISNLKGMLAIELASWMELLVAYQTLVTKFT